MGPLRLFRLAGFCPPGVRAIPVPGQRRGCEIVPVNSYSSVHTAGFILQSMDCTVQSDSWHDSQSVSRGTYDSQIEGECAGIDDYLVQSA